MKVEVKKSGYSPNSFTLAYKILAFIYLSIGIILFTTSIIIIFSFLSESPSTTSSLGVSQPGIVLFLKYILLSIPFLTSGAGFSLNNKRWIKLGLVISAIIILNLLTGLQNLEEQALNEIFRAQKMLSIFIWGLLEPLSQGLLLILTITSLIIVVAEGRKNEK